MIRDPRAAATAPAVAAALSAAILAGILAARWPRAAAIAARIGA
jgi:hypothetical protein